MSVHAMQCPMCQRGQPCEVAAVDATLDVTAELARVTARVAELELEVNTGRDAHLVMTRRLFGVEAERDRSRALGAARVRSLAKGYREQRARAEKAEAELERERMRLAACGVVAMSNTPETAEKNRAIHADYLSASLGDVIRAVDSEMAHRARAEKAEAEIERLKAIIADQSRDESGRVSMPLAAHDKIDAARKDRDEAEARAEQAEKVNTTLRVLGERARECLASTSHHEDCSRTDECDDADPGDCGEHGSGGCPACDCGASEWHETAAELHAALKGTT